MKEDLRNRRSLYPFQVQRARPRCVAECTSASIKKGSNHNAITKDLVNKISNYSLANTIKHLVDRYSKRCILNQIDKDRS